MLRFLLADTGEANRAAVIVAWGLVAGLAEERGDKAGRTYNFVAKPLAVQV